MSERSRNIIVALTAILGIAGAGFLIILFGYAPEWLREGYEVRVTLVESAGLREGSIVKYRGIPVGEIVEIGFEGGTGGGVYAVAVIEPEYGLPADVFGLVRAESLIAGGASLFLSRPEGATPTDRTLATDGSAVIEGRPDGITEGIVGQMEELLAEPMGQLNRLTVQFEKLSEEWTKVGRNIAALTEPRTLADVDVGQHPANLTSMIARTDQRLSELKEVLENAQSAFAGVNDWVYDDDLKADVAATVANTRALTEQMGEQVADLSKRYAKVADDLSLAIKEVEKTASAAREGDGTVAKLINDPSLYENLDDAAERLKLLLDEANALMEKLKKEGLPVKFGEK